MTDPQRPGVPRPIVGFHADAEGHWVAELACGHAQHVRHDPPWQRRPWVTTAEGRARFLGVELGCVRCADVPAPAGEAARRVTLQAVTTTHPELMNLPIEPVAAVLVGEADPEIVAAEAALRTAQLAADVAALDRLIGEDLLFTGPDGQLGTKAQDLEAHGSGAVRVRAHEPEELRIRRVRANVAVAALRTRLTVEVGGSVVHGTYRYTRVWAREGVGPGAEGGGTWRVVGGHVSEVPPTGGPAPHA